jgi:hypothetical protein
LTGVGNVAGKLLMTQNSKLTWSGTTGTLYGIIGAWEFAFALNLFWWERAGAPIFDKIKLHPKLPSAILIGVFVILIVALFLTYMCDRYRRATPAAHSRIDRLPLPFVEVPNVDDALPRGLRVIFFLGFIIGPLYVAGHFIRVLGATRFFDRENSTEPGHPFFEWSSLFFSEGTWSGENRFRIGDVDGVAFFPTVEPYFILLLFFGAVAYAIYFLVRLVLDGRTQPA